MVAPLILFPSTESVISPDPSTIDGSLRTMSMRDPKTIIDEITNDAEMYDNREYTQFDKYISQLNQLSVHIMEASDLRAADISGYSDPYVTVKLTGVRPLAALGSNPFPRTFKREFSTYYIRQNLNPKWTHQQVDPKGTSPISSARHVDPPSPHLHNHIGGLRRARVGSAASKSTDPPLQGPGS